MSADLEGYKTAQALLRAEMGQDVPFFIPTPTVWPPGVPSNAQGIPLDPSVAPLASGFASASVRCSVANRPARGAMTPPKEDEPIGIGPSSHLLLVMSKTDYDDNGIDDATWAHVYGVAYKVEVTQPDQVGGGEVQRMLVFVERE